MGKPVTVNLRYFAILREQRGIGSEQLSTMAETPAALYDALKNQYGFTLPADRVRVAINDQFDGMDRLLRDGDNVVFVPPVAGG